MTAKKDLCRCGNAKGAHEIACKTCWREVPHIVKRELSDSPDPRVSAEARRQILAFCSKRKSLVTS